MLTAVSPMIINEVKFNSMNQNMVGAQFAAEAGAKVAIAAIDAKNANWDWLNNIQYLVSGDTTKSYTVKSIIKKDDGTNIIGEPAAGTTYTITSEGKVIYANNTAIKTVVVTVTVPGGSGGPPPNLPVAIGDAAFYAGNEVSFKNNIEVNGASSYSVNITKSQKAISYDSGYEKYSDTKKALDFPTTTYDATAHTLNVITKSTTDPKTTYTKTYDFTTPQTLTNSTTSINLNEANHNAAYASSNWEPSGKVTITGSGVLYVDGNFLLNNDITCSDGVLIVVKGNLGGEKANNVTINKAALLIYGNVEEFKNNFTLTGTIAITGSIAMTKSNNATFNYDAAVASAWLPTSSNGGNPTGTGTTTGSIVVSSWKSNAAATP